MNKTFGQYIRQLRLGKELTLTQLAAKLNMDSANLSKVENGKRAFDIKKIPILANEFELDTKHLREEFLSDKFAKILYESSCSMKVLKLAEEKVKYLLAKQKII